MEDILLRFLLANKTIMLKVAGFRLRTRVLMEENHTCFEKVERQKWGVAGYISASFSSHVHEKIKVLRAIATLLELVPPSVCFRHCLHLFRYLLLPTF